MVNKLLSLESLLDDPLLVTTDFVDEMRHLDEDDYWDDWDQDPERMDFEDPWSELYAAV